MEPINYIAILTVTVIAFIISAVYYIVLNKQVMKLRGQKPSRNTVGMPAWKVIVELARTFVLGVIIAYAVTFLGLTMWNQGLILAIWLWIGFPVILLLGSVLHENVPPKLAAIHAGDWLIKLVLFAVILTIWN